MRQIHGLALAALCALVGAPAAGAAPRLHAQDLGPAWANGVARALDPRGVVAGSIVDPASPGTSHASVAQGIGMHDVNAPLDADSGDALIEAVAINDRDPFVCNSANGRVYLLTPVAR